MADKKKKQKTVIISAHGDTNWKNHSMVIRECPNGNGQEYHGHMDNFGGVHAVMNAYFSGKLPLTGVRLEITYAEETTMEGAREVARTLSKADIVLVVDVTGTPTQKDIVIEKCYNKRLRRATTDALTKAGVSFDLYSGCPDPICHQDESDVYRKRSIDGISNALAVLCQALQSFETEDVNAQPPDDQDLAAQMEFMTMTSF